VTTQAQQPGAPAWDREGRDWPNRPASRFVTAGGLRWHVQVAGSGDGPDLLLLHGTGAATHSWAGLLPLLARHARVIAPDLPGHGFTAVPRGEGLSLPGMARAVAALLTALEARPALVAGHSAGAAILLRMALDRQIAPRAVIGLNAALLPWDGVAGQIFSPLARLLVGIPAVPWLLSRRAADRAVVERLLRGTGSVLTDRQTELYARLFRCPRHVGAALGMMAAWDLHTLARMLPRVQTPLLLLAGGNDRTVPPGQAKRVQAMVPAARRTLLPGLGHLAHEERPEVVAPLILGELARNDSVAPPGQAA
jgi:magnesium chelatase accessory protein